MNKEVYEHGKEREPKKRGVTLLYLVMAIVLGLIAVGLLVIYIISLAVMSSNPNLTGDIEYKTFFIFIGHTATPVMSLIMYIDARRGRKNSWLTAVLLICSLAFTVSMYADLTYYFVANSTKLYGVSYRFFGAYNFNQYYIPTALTPFFVWLMVRARRRISVKPQYSDSDTRSERSVRTIESAFYVITVVLALTLLIGALIGLVTGGGWGALASMLWGWMLAIPMWMALIIWMVLFYYVKSIERKADNQKHSACGEDGNE